MSDLFQHLSKAPTNPRSSRQARSFDVAELFQGPLDSGASSADQQATPLDEKLRQAYFWIVNSAVISPHYDIEYNEQSPREFRVGDSRSRLTLPSAQSYSSFILLPLLTFAVRGKCLLVGGPGRGKTASAVLMGILAGYSLKAVRRAMQHGQPQMTVADLLGNPLPADLISAQSMDQIRIAWRHWLSMRVRIVDEYNRIPTRTQSALLTLMGDNYAEILNHIHECEEGAWYLTANDEQGGGTYQVIEALKDRIDVVVQALSFNPRFLSELLTRIEEDLRPEEAVPAQIIFNAAEIDRMQSEIRAIDLPAPLRRRLEFFVSQFEFCEGAAIQFEYKSKDSVRLRGSDWQAIKQSDTGRDRLRDLGCQTLNGLSVRAIMSLLRYAKALAYFRGNAQVALDDLRQVLPFVLHERLTPDLDAPFFEQSGHQAYRSDRIGWLRALFDAACAEYERLDLDRDDPVAVLQQRFAQGLDGLSEVDVRARLVEIERLIERLAQGGKLYGHIYDDLLKLKYLHQRYSNYLQWLTAP